MVLELQILVKKRIVYFSLAVEAITAALPVQRRIRGRHLEEFWSWSCVASDGVHDMDNEGKTLNIESGQVSRGDVGLPNVPFSDRKT